MPEADLGIEIAFQPSTPDPSRVFRTMTDLIQAFEEIDHDLVRSIDSKIEPILLLEDVETSSVKAWLRNALNAIDDDALKNLDWKPAVGKYIVKAKYLIVDFINKRITLTDNAELQTLGLNLLEAAKETDVLRLPAYQPLTPTRIARSIERISSATSALKGGDSATYLSDYGNVGFNLEFHLAPEQIEELLTRESRVNRAVMIFKVKKPDYLGSSMWDLHHDGRTIQATIADAAWLGEFQDQKITLQPGDSIEADVEIRYNYGYDNEVVSSQYSILEIKRVLSRADQQSLPLQ